MDPTELPALKLTVAPGVGSLGVNVKLAVSEPLLPGSEIDTDLVPTAEEQAELRALMLLVPVDDQLIWMELEFEAPLTVPPATLHVQPLADGEQFEAEALKVSIWFGVPDDGPLTLIEALGGGGGGVPVAMMIDGVCTYTSDSAPRVTLRQGVYVPAAVNTRDVVGWLEPEPKAHDPASVPVCPQS